MNSLKAPTMQHVRQHARSCKRTDWKYKLCVCAIVGGAWLFHGVGGLTLGELASFLTFNKSFNMPINQVSQQFNSIVMALAGADRIFPICWMKSRKWTKGYVTLVNAKEENGNLLKSKEHTGLLGMEALPHQADGSVDYIELKGDVVFDDVDFGYNAGTRSFCMISTLYAQPGQKIAFVGSTGAGKDHHHQSDQPFL